MHFAPRIVLCPDLSLQDFPAIAHLESLVAFGNRLAEEVDGNGCDWRHVGLNGFDMRHCRLALVRTEVARYACDFLPQEGEVLQQIIGDTIGCIACIDKAAVAEQSAETSGQRAVDAAWLEGIVLVERDVIVLRESGDEIVGPAVLRHRSDDGIVVVGADTDLLPSEADIVVEEGVGSRSARLEHIVVTIVECQTADKYVPVLVMVAVEALHRTRPVAAEGDAVIDVMDAFRRTSSAIASELDAIAVAAERGGARQIVLHPEMVLGIATLPCPAFGNDDAVVGLIEVPGIVGVAPGTATDEAVALAIVHLAGETIGIRSVVAVEVAVVMRIAIDHVVVGTELTIVG